MEGSLFESDSLVALTVRENAFVNLIDCVLPQSAALKSFVDCLLEAQVQHMDAAFLLLEYAASVTTKFVIGTNYKYIESVLTYKYPIYIRIVNKAN